MFDNEIGQDIILIIRMLISCILGIAIGFERNNRAKEAGVRTHCIVACASAMMMIISKYGFEDLLEFETAADVRLDPSRMAQGIVTGVGFIGAGIIYVQRSNIRGLTTAAGLWAGDRDGDRQRYVRDRNIRDGDNPCGAAFVTQEQQVHGFT